MIKLDADLRKPSSMLRIVRLMDGLAKDRDNEHNMNCYSYQQLGSKHYASIARG